MSITLLWDASALSKRYVAEHGSDTVNGLFTWIPGFAMVFTLAGYGETYSILRRRLNASFFTRQTYAVARTALRLEILESIAFQLLPVDGSILASLPLIDRHNINATDAAILAAYLDYRATLPVDDSRCVLVASDHRLLREARAEGLPALDPEMIPPANVPSFLNSL